MVVQHLRLGTRFAVQSDQARFQRLAAKPFFDDTDPVFWDDADSCQQGQEEKTNSPTQNLIRMFILSP